MTDQLADNSKAGSPDGAGDRPQGPPGGPKRSPVAVALAAVVSLVVVVGIIAFTALLTAERLSGSAESPREQQGSAGSEPAEKPSASRPATVKPRTDAFFSEMIKAMSYLARGTLGSDSDDGRPGDPGDLQERVRMARHLAPIDSDRTGNEIPDDLILPEGSRVLTVVGAQGTGPRDTVILARAAGHAEAVEDHFRAEAKRLGWKAASRPAKGGGGVRALLMEKGLRVRLVTIRELASGDQCVVAVYDGPGQKR